ncbi:MAG: DUF3623 domain-containing protein [Proteobacteria bacterium]|nr:DUF3623 domain-containing protein [Pseudomonadota bacterium]
MAEHGFTFLLVILAWWLSTGVVMWLCALPRRTFAWSFCAASFVLMASVYGLIRSAPVVSAGGAYIAFASALGIWGWIEMSFLMGFITGPSHAPCPADATGFRRFRLALETLLYHELAIVIAAIGIVALTWNAPNQTGTFAFLILMAMRISAKLNIFLGVPNLTDEFLPERLAYLKSYFRKRACNLLFPVSIVLSTAIAVVLARRVLGAAGAEAVGFALLLALVALAMLEHFFMLLPLPDATLWRWAIPATTKPIDKALP